MTERPFITFLTPAYNAADTIAESIASVLKQEGAPFELVVIDDGSTDDTAAVAAAAIGNDPRARIVSRRNGGSGAALNTGAAAASGTWLSMVDADDFLADDALKKRIAFMEAHPGYTLYSFGFVYLDPDGTTDPPLEGRVQCSVTVDDLLSFPLIPGNAMFRAEDLEAIGGFHEQCYNEDYDLWIRLLLNGATHIHQPEPLYFYRRHPGQKTADLITMRVDDIAILSEVIATGLLDEHQLHLARRMIATYRRHTALRRILYKIIGRDRTEALIRKIRDRA